MENLELVAAKASQMANNLTLRLGNGSGETTIGNHNNSNSILRRSTSMSGGAQSVQSGFFNRDANARRSLTMANQVKIIIKNI